MKFDKSALLPHDLRTHLALYAVTDRRWLKNTTLAEQVEKAIHGGATFVQLREKDTPENELFGLAVSVQTVCRKYNVPFVINDNVELAKKIDADGVHVGQGDMPPSDVRRIIGNEKIVGVSAQSVEQALLAEQNGADYLGVGAVFATDSKRDADFVPYDVLKNICSAVTIPVVAIGGINAKNIVQLKGSGIAGVSVISAIFAADDIENASRVLKQQVHSIL